MHKTLLVLAGLSLLAACSGADEPGEMEEETVSSGIELSGFDMEVRPQDDLNQYVNGTWIAETEIPADRSSWGSFNILRDESETWQEAIIRELATATDLAPGSDERKISDLFNSLMDEALIEEQGTASLQPLLARIADAKTHEDIIALFAEARKYGVGVPFLIFVTADFEDSQRYAVNITQSGLGLPNRNYYLQEGERYDAIRAAYPGYLASLFGFAGYDAGDARAQRVYDLEMKIAEAQWAPEQNRNQSLVNNKIAVADLATEAGDLAWPTFLEAASLSGQDVVVIRQPSYLQALATIFQETPVETWVDYLIAQVLNGFAGNLSSDFVNANFEFNNKMIRGAQELAARWQRSVRTMNGIIGESVGKVWVERHFPPEAKARMVEMVQNILAAFESSIDQLEWMSDDTKARAQEKREKFGIKIGYPDRWRDYSGLEISADDSIDNLINAALFSYNDGLSKLDESMRRWEWGMTPQTVNAYHNPRMNEIVFPAAILQPPFFDLSADDAVNYGGIGAVIGHEIGHAFDDQGRKTDSNGNLNDWWTEADAAAFEEKAAAFAAQYSALEPLPGLFVNGQLTLGENIGDLTGVYIGYKAYKASLNGEEAPVIDGFTGDQRFFIGWAQIWRAKQTEESLRLRVETDPHSPSMYRVNAPLRNFDAFYEAFEVAPGDGMYLPPEERIKIW